MVFQKLAPSLLFQRLSQSHLPTKIPLSQMWSHMQVGADAVKYVYSVCVVETRYIEHSYSEFLPVVNKFMCPSWWSTVKVYLVIGNFRYSKNFQCPRGFITVRFHCTCVYTLIIAG